MEGVLSVQQLDFSYQRLTLGMIQQGQIQGQKTLEGQNLADLMDELQDMPGEAIELGESENPLDAIRGKVGEGTAFFMIYEEIHVRFTEARFTSGGPLPGPEGIEDGQTFLDKVNGLFGRLKDSSAKPYESLKEAIKQLIDEAFDTGKERVEKLGGTQGDTQDQIEEMLRDVLALVQEYFA